MKTTKQMTMQEYADFRGVSYARIYEIIRKIKEGRPGHIALCNTGSGPDVCGVEISTVGKTRVLTVTYFE